MRLLPIMFVAGCCCKQVPPPEYPNPPPDPALAAVSWLEGTWRGDGDSGTEEHWTMALGGTMLGVNRTVSDGKMVHHEFLTIAVDEGRIEYRASPSGQAPNTFTLVTIEPRRVVFEDKSHDFPQRIIYRLDGDTLVGRVEGTEGGKPKHSEWRWRRVR